VRTHNLKAIDLDLPVRKLIAITGVSGAGKSSLALDTLFAEGQRRYIETFSPYTRQFLARLDKPDADAIDGIPPAIAVGQPAGLHSLRSTVGTVTEIHDALALLFVGAGEVFCPACGHKVEPGSPAVIARAIGELAEGTRYEIAFPLDLRPETDRAALIRSLREQGFVRIRAEGRAALLDEPGLSLPDHGSVDVVVDRLVRGKDPLERTIDSIETAFAHGLGRCRLVTDSQATTYLRGWRCGVCGTECQEPRPELFRYGSALGACPECEGVGRTRELDLDRLVPDRGLSLRAGAIAPKMTGPERHALDAVLERLSRLGIALDVPFRQLSPDSIARLLDGDPKNGIVGIRTFFRDLERRPGKDGARALRIRWRLERTCPACQGARLRPEALAVKLAGQNISTLSALAARDARAFLAELDLSNRPPAVAAIRAQAEARLGYLAAIGLDYLTLDRPLPSLSGGERTRVSLTKSMASGLVNALYVLDEPTLGLHPHDVDRLLAIISGLRDRGNTVVVVEHDPALITAADHVIDLGPGAGAAGGAVLYAGDPKGLTEASGSLTADYLSGRKRLITARARRPANGPAIRLIGARGHNLKSIDVTFPLGVLTVVTGVSGSGKSTLVEETLYRALKNRLAPGGEPAAPYSELIETGQVAEVVFLDQAPLPRSVRSNPVTQVRAFDEIRKTFAATHEAKLRNYDAGRFSFNVGTGRCQACQGYGYHLVDMQFLPDVMVRCPECQGTRYRPETLEVTYRGKNIAEVLDLTAREAFGFFRNRAKVQARLSPLLDLGLDYLRLGQPVTTLSGGESQRLKLAGFLAKTTAALKRPGAGPHTLFLLDEPSAGLHPNDMVKLLETLTALVERGNSVIVIEHRAAVMAAADWIIDLGPGAGDQGGEVVAEGTPEAVAKTPTPTGQLLARVLAV
jgi:excinuclease ABC subunit A